MEYEESLSFKEEVLKYTPDIDINLPEDQKQFLIETALMEYQLDQICVYSAQLGAGYMIEYAHMGLELIGKDPCRLLHYILVELRKRDYLLLRNDYIRKH